MTYDINRDGQMVINKCYLFEKQEKKFIFVGEIDADPLLSCATQEQIVDFLLSDKDVEFVKK